MKLNIPFIPNRVSECGQTCVAMAIKYFYPEYQINIDEFNKIIKYKTNMYTFPTQLVLLLDNYGVSTKFYSNENLITTKEEPNLFKRWFGKDYEENKKYIDAKTYDWAVEECRKKNLFEKKTTSFDELIALVKNNIVVIIPVDWNTLQNIEGPYAGDFVIISGVEENTLLLHETDNGPYIKYPLDTVKKAWEHPAIADDYIAVFGRK